VSSKPVTIFEAAGTPSTTRQLRLRRALGISVFLLGLALALARVAPLRDVGALRLGTPWIMSDFRHAVYYPSRAFWEGLNPYSSSRYMERYPVSTVVSPYAPASFLLFAPFGLLPLGPASAAYFILTVVLTLVLAWVALRLSGWRASASAILAVAGILLLSRPGHWNLLSGQVTLIVVLATYAALTCARSAPHLAGAGLAIALLKPSFGLPLIPVLLARGAPRAVAWGFGIAAALNVPILLVLMTREGGSSSFLTTLVQSYRMFAASPDNDVLHGVWRVDLVASLSRLLDYRLGASAMLLVNTVILVVLIVVSRRLVKPDDPTHRRILDGLACCGVLLCFYHQAYDLLLLALPGVGLARVLHEKIAPRAIHVFQGLLFTILSINYLATLSALAALQLANWARLVVVSANGLALIGLFGLYLAEAQASDRLARVPALSD
jgi:hypothetical protein